MFRSPFTPRRRHLGAVTRSKSVHLSGFLMTACFLAENSNVEARLRPLAAQGFDAHSQIVPEECETCLSWSVPDECDKWR